MSAAVVSGSGRAMVEVARFSELEEGRLKLVRAEHARIALVRIGDRVHAVGAMCTHARIFVAPGRLTPEGLIECPMHGAQFSPLDGAVRCPPATQPLPVFETRLIDDIVFVDPGPEPESEPESTTRPGGRPSTAQWGKWS